MNPDQFEYLRNVVAGLIVGTLFLIFFWAAWFFGTWTIAWSIGRICASEVIPGPEPICGALAKEGL